MNRMLTLNVTLYLRPALASETDKILPRGGILGIGWWTRLGSSSFSQTFDLMSH